MVSTADNTEQSVFDTVNYYFNQYFNEYIKEHMKYIEEVSKYELFKELPRLIFPTRPGTFITSQFPSDPAGSEETLEQYNQRMKEKAEKRVIADMEAMINKKKDTEDRHWTDRLQDGRWPGAVGTAYEEKL